MDKLPILLADAVTSDIAFEAKVFTRQSVLAAFDASTLRGGNAGFRIVCLDEPAKEFSVTVQTANGTAIQGSDYIPVSSDYIFTGEGLIDVETLGTPIETDQEFTLSISSSDGLLLRPVATGRIRGVGNTHVYATGVYDAGVYQ